MNKPVGVPSGWEEIAAWYQCMKHTAWDRIRIVAAHEDEFTNDPHDWRVIE